jgi:hypothetical protein
LLLHYDINLRLDSIDNWTIRTVFSIKLVML